MTLAQLRLTIQFCLSRPYRLKEIIPQPGVVIGYLVQCDKDLNTEYSGVVIGISHTLEQIKLRLKYYD